MAAPGTEYAAVLRGLMADAFGEELSQLRADEAFRGRTKDMAVLVAGLEAGAALASPEQQEAMMAHVASRAGDLGATGGAGAPAGAPPPGRPVQDALRAASIR